MSNDEAQWAEFVNLPTPTLQVGEALLAMRQVVRDVGDDFVHDSAVCWYVKDGCPSCLIGRVLHKLGLSVAQLVACDDNRDPRISKQWQALGLFRETGAVLAAAQGAQDNGATWGQALAALPTG